MKIGDEILYWKYKDGPYPVHNVTTNLPNDSFIPVKLAAEPANDRVISTNQELYDYILNSEILSNWSPFVFFPTTLAAGLKNYKIIDAQMTGGRCFMPSKQASEILGLPYKIYLNLDKIGWGKGLLELRLEIKGAGTIFKRTKIYRTRFEKILQTNLEMNNLFEVGKIGQFQHTILSSMADFLNRNMGGQSEKFAKHSIQASSALLNKSTIKFVPSWMAISYSDQSMNNQKMLNSALPKNIPLYDGVSANEIRFTPSTVRALYFDNASSDNQLRMLISRVSKSKTELNETLENIIEDAKKYLELISHTSQKIQGDKIAWIKIGDIHEKFVKDSKGQYKEAYEYRQQKFSWVLAKDEVIVRKVGKFYTDMESYHGKDIGYISKNMDDLLFHHELYILNVLRDHIRICTKFSVAIDLISEEHISFAKRQLIGKTTIDKIINSINSSANLNIKIDFNKVYVRIFYEQLNIKHTYIINRKEIAEPY